MTETTDTNKMIDLVNLYKLTAILSELFLKKSEYTLVENLYIELKNIYCELLEYIKTNYPESIYKSVVENRFNELPDEFKILSNIELYNKILALKYLESKPESHKTKIIFDKMSIDFNEKEELAYIDLAKILLEDKKYIETIALCDYIKTLSDTAPVWEISGDAYRNLKMYGDSIENYKHYLSINEYDDEVQKKLDDTYKEICQ